MLMYMQEEGGFRLNYKLGKLDRSLYSSNKGHLRVKEVLAHQSALQAWIPFYRQTIDEDNSLRDTLYSNSYSAKYPIKVAEDLYLHNSYPDSILQQVIESDFLEEKEYRYSDLGYFLFKEIMVFFNAKNARRWRAKWNF